MYKSHRGALFNELIKLRVLFPNHFEQYVITPEAVSASGFPQL